MMNDGRNAESKEVQDQNAGKDVRGSAPSDFVTGLVTFIVFLFFMTAWMYFYSE